MTENSRHNLSNFGLGWETVLQVLAQHDGTYLSPAPLHRTRVNQFPYQDDDCDGEPMGEPVPTAAEVRAAKGTIYKSPEQLDLGGTVELAAVVVLIYFQRKYVC